MIVAAFAAIYLIWGSTYLAIRFAIETLPPFLMAGVRFLVAGSLLFGWALLKGAPLPDRGQVRDATIVGLLLLLVGNGAVVWAEQWVPSGLAALLIATVPLWMVLIDWLWAGRPRPRPAVWASIALGLCGVALLVGTDGIRIESPEELIGMAAILGGSFVWAAGSIYSRGARLPVAPRMGTAVQMLSGGTALLLVGSLLGEWGRFSVETTSAKSIFALLYLIFVGGIIGYGAYIWLLREAPAERVATYAYVNPVVALFLGWWLASEPIGPRTILAAFVTLSSVVMLNLLTRRGWGVSGPPEGKKL